MDLNSDTYFLILQKLKEKAVELEKLIDKRRNIKEWGKTEESNLSFLEKDLIKVSSSGNRFTLKDLGNIQNIFKSQEENEYPKNFFWDSI